METVLLNIGILYTYIFLYFLCFNKFVANPELSPLVFMLCSAFFTVTLYLMFDPIIGVSFK